MKKFQTYKTSKKSKIIKIIVIGGGLLLVIASFLPFLPYFLGY